MSQDIGLGQTKWLLAGDQKPEKFCQIIEKFYGYLKITYL